MVKRIYYGAGVLCLALSALILLNTHIPPNNLTNSVVLWEKTDAGYKDHYHIGFPMPKNSLRRGTVYLPVYSVREEHHLWQIIAPFDMLGAAVTEYDEYFEAATADETLRIYKFIDLLEYDNSRRGRAEEATDEVAVEIAENFMLGNLPHKKPYDTHITREDDAIKVKFTGQLAGLPNNAFPTEIIMDSHGNITSAAHFFFDYEALGSADVISVKEALARLPRDYDHKISLKGYDLVYGFEDSVLVPLYYFFGEHRKNTSSY